jgi:hypothetical protein
VLVDKGWFEKGLETYSTEAIFNSLRHFGVDLDEAAFRALAAVDYPLTIATAWHERWKGKGRFARLPAAAAEELWRRLCAPAIAPTDLTLALIKLLTMLNQALEGTPNDGTWHTRFAVVEEYLAHLPEAPAQREKFVREATGALGDWRKVFDSMAESLARGKHDELADRFVWLEETLLPSRKGSAKALVKAAAGDVVGAVADLLAIAADPAKNDYVRLSAVDGLLELDRLSPAKQTLEALLEKAEASRDFELASHVVELLTALLKRDPTRADKHQLRARVESLAQTLGEPRFSVVSPPSGPPARAR